MVKQRVNIIGMGTSETLALAGEIYIKQSKPVTSKEAIEQMEKLRKSANWNNKTNEQQKILYIP